LQNAARGALRGVFCCGLSSCFVRVKLKCWRREWKIQLIEPENLLWSDLYELLIAELNSTDPVFMGPG
jgi:hypothetical protein